MSKMNKWVVIPIIVILTIGTITNGVFYLQESSNLNEAESRIAALEGNVPILGVDISNLEGNLSTLEGNVSTLGEGISTLEGDVSTLEGDVSTLEGNVSTLEGGVSALEGNVSTLGGDVSTLEGNLSAAEGNVSALEGDVSALEAHDRAVMDVVAMVQPSVVMIEADLGDGWYGGGSGVIISNTGYVLTNQHVIDDAISVEITLMDGTTYDATIVAEDAYRDLAIVEIVSNRTDFPAAVLGSSADITVGEQVVAIGYPYQFRIGEPATFTRGIVSAIRVTDYYTGDFLEYIQTDAAVNPGNSGGPLVNLKGEVIGINTWKVFLAGIDGERMFAEGLNFAIPIDEIKLFIQDTIG